MRQKAFSIVPYLSRIRLVSGYKKNKNRAYTLFFYHAAVAPKGNIPFIVSAFSAFVVLMQDGFIIKSSVLTVSTFYLRCKGSIYFSYMQIFLYFYLFCYVMWSF